MGLEAGEVYWEQRFQAREDAKKLDRPPGLNYVWWLLQHSAPPEQLRTRMVQSSL